MKLLSLSLILNVVLCVVVVMQQWRAEVSGIKVGEVDTNKVKYDVLSYFSYIHTRASQKESLKRLHDKASNIPKQPFLINNVQIEATLKEVIESVKEGDVLQLISNVDKKNTKEISGAEHWSDFKWPYITKSKGKDFFIFNLDCWGCLEWALNLKEKAPNTVIMLGSKWSVEKQILFLSQLHCTGNKNWDFEKQRKLYQNMENIQSGLCKEAPVSEEWKKEVVILSDILKENYQIPIFSSGDTVLFWEQGVSSQLRVTELK